MNDLTVINLNGQLVTDSREVAEMTGKRHSDLLESIKGYNQYLENGKFRSQDFFIPSTYKTEGNNKSYECFLLTRKGCDMVANKMTGEKGVLFTAAYVTKFEEMEKQLKPACIEDVLIQSLQEMKDMRLQVQEAKQQAAEVKEEVQAIRDVVEIKPSDSWRNETNILVKKVCYKLSDYSKPKEEVYKALQERAACDLKRRLENMRARLLLNGGSKSKADNMNFLDVIADDKKLIEIYTAIVKEMAIKYKVA